MNDVALARIPRAHAAQLGRLRTVPGVDVGEDGESLWVRAAESTDAIQRVFRSLPDAETFSLLPDDQLIRTGSLLPSERCPTLQWRKLAHWLAINLPTPALPAVVTKRAGLHLVRGGAVREPHLLLCPRAVWTAYGGEAPQVRLDRWRFALSSTDDVLIRGVPLPPLPGTQFVEDSRIAVPCGHHWSPRVDAAVVARLFGLGPNDVLLWVTDERREIVPADQFVKATRSAIRLSAATGSQAPTP